MRVLIIIPSYNEEKNIEKVINNLKDNYPQYDYLIVNDCSTDNTKNICIKNQYQYVSLCTNLGIGGGVQTGYMFAVENGYDISVQIDGDGQHDPLYLEKLINVMQQEHADMVIGSRFIQNKGFQTSASRRVGIRIINTIIKWCTGLNITDSTSGFRVCSRRMTEFFALNYAQDYPEPEAIVAAALNGFRVMEYPVEMREREEGTSSINFIRSIYYMIKVTCAIVLQRFTK